MYARSARAASIFPLFVLACSPSDATDPSGMNPMGGQMDAAVPVSAWKAPAYDSGPVSGKIAGRAFTYTVGLAYSDAADSRHMVYELLGYTPDSSTSIKCWTRPPQGTDEAQERSVYFVLPKEAGTFEWGGGRMVAGRYSISLFSMQSGVPHTWATDQAKVTIDAYSADAKEVTGSIAAEGDKDNLVNGKFTVKQCDL